MKVLYLHQKVNGGVHNVGRAWFENMEGMDVTFKQYNEVSPTELDYYDVVLHLFKSWEYFPNKNMNKSILCIHDPIEFIYGKDTPKLRELGVIGTANRIICPSEQEGILLRKLLRRDDIKVVPTRGYISEINHVPITTKCDFITIGTGVKRKNPELVKILVQYAEKELHRKYMAKIKGKFLYLLPFYRHYEVYVCTSHKEGGPLPPMESMANGGVVISTPVGQMPEIIENGINGFICKSEKDFKDSMKKLSEDLNLLGEMRKNSLRIYKIKRDRKIVQSKLKSAIL